MQGLILDYGATIDSNGKHWSEVLWEGYCSVSLPITKEQFREAYVYAERYISFNPEIIQSDYNFFRLMQIRIGIQVDYLLQQGMLSEPMLRTTLKIISDGELPILENMTELSGHFVDIIAGYCYDYARRCTLEAIPLLDKLSSKYVCSIVSNFYGNLAAVLQDFGILRCFRYVIDSSVVGIRKPDPGIFEVALDKMGLPAKEVTVIGDSYRKDIAPAISLGCKAIWVKGDGWDNNDKEIEFEPTVSSILQLYDML